jgi:hypothetical protein
VDASVLLVVVAVLCCAALRPSLMVYNHSALYCLKSLAHMQGSALCLFVCVCVMTGLLVCWAQVLL